MKIFFSVGEPSGDLHGANLIRQLRRRDPRIEVVGYGGPKMAAAGCQLHEDLTRLAIMWFWRVLTNLWTFWRLLVRADRYFRDCRPDAVVLIDYPGFNWWIARRAKARGIPVVYYGTPQIWAWARWRVRKMRRLVDHVLCKLPFEETWYRQHGCHATYVGHPYFDELLQRKLDQDFLRQQKHPGRPLVTILPGSRSQEVSSNLWCFLNAAEVIHRQLPHVRFAVASFREDQADMARALLRERGLPIEVWVDRTAELIHLAHCCMACSGSVSLELLFHRKPAVVLYWINRIAYVVQGFFRRVRYITLVNLLSTDEIYTAGPGSRDPNPPSRASMPFPEYLTYRDRSLDLAQHIIHWLTDAEEFERRVKQLDELRGRLAHGGTSGRVADYLLEHCQRTGSSPIHSPGESAAEISEMETTTRDPIRYPAA